MWAWGISCKPYQEQILSQTSYITQIKLNPEKWDGPATLSQITLTWFEKLSQHMNDWISYVIYFVENCD